MTRYARNAVALTVMLGALSSTRAEVVINEIFYAAPNDLDLEYIELLNTGKSAVDLSGWTFEAGISYTFPQGAKIEGGDYLVLARSAALLREFYSVEAFAEFKGALANSGETITLKKSTGDVVESVSFGDRAPWPLAADGYSASIERICPRSSAALPANWAPSTLSLEDRAKPSGTPGAANGAYSATLPPMVRSFEVDATVVEPGKALNARARFDSAVRPTSVELVYHIVDAGKTSEDVSVSMTRGDDGVYVAAVPGQDAGRLVRLRVRATAADGAVRVHPAPNSIRPAVSVYVAAPIEIGKIPVSYIVSAGEEEKKRGEEYRRNQGRQRGFGFGPRREPTPAERLRQRIESQLSSDPLESAWAKATLSEASSGGGIETARSAFAKAEKHLATWRRELESMSDGDLEAFAGSLNERLAIVRSELLASLGNADSETKTALGALGNVDESRGRERGRRGFGDRNPASMVSRFFNVEESWYRVAMLEAVNAQSAAKLRAIHAAAIESRGRLASSLEEAGEFDFRDVFEQVGAAREQLEDDVYGALDSEARAALEQRRDRRRGRGRGGFGRRGSAPAVKPIPARGRSALVWIDPRTKQPQLFDFINVTERKSGLKVRLHKDRPLNGMTTLNILYEGDERSILTEALAYELYALTGNPTVKSGYTRVLIDGELAGYHLYFEQPNGNFFRRSGINDRGNLYKIIWMGSHRPSARTPKDKIPDRQDVIGRHEKVTNVHDGYEDIVGLVKALEDAPDDEAQWKVIAESFDVDQVINYFAVNTLLSHWDGFFNNYFVYHDSKGSGKWTLHPWDQDSTWGHRMNRGDGVFAEMPLTFGMEGDVPPGQSRSERRERGGRRRGFRGFGGGPGAGWWREGGEISKPLLANPKFRQLYLARLKVLAETVYTPAVFEPKFRALEDNLRDEVEARAIAMGRTSADALNRFDSSLAFFREHLEKRRAYILREIERELSNP